MHLLPLVITPAAAILLGVLCTQWPWTYQLCHLQQLLLGLLEAVLQKA